MVQGGRTDEVAVTTDILFNGLGSPPPWELNNVDAMLPSSSSPDASPSTSAVEVAL